MSDYYYDWQKEQQEVARYKQELEQYQEKIKTIGKKTAMSETEFNDLFPMMLESDDPVIADAFEQMLLVGKLIFGQELGEIAAARSRHRQNQIAMRKARDAKDKKRDEKWNRIDQIAEKIIARRLALLERVMHEHTQYVSLKGKEKMDIDELILSKHIRKGLFGILKVKSISKIPTSKLASARKEALVDKSSIWDRHFMLGMF